MQLIRPPQATYAVLLELVAAGAFYLFVVGAFGITRETRRRYVEQLASLSTLLADLRTRPKPAAL
jgi:hypothetical protein